MAGSITLTSNGRDFTCKTLDKAVQAIIDGGKNWTEVHLVDMTLEISGDCEDVWDTLEYWIWTVQNLAVEMALTRLVVRDLKARKTDGTTIVLPLVWCKYSSMYKYVPNKPEIEGEWFQCRDYGFEAYGRKSFPPLFSHAAGFRWRCITVVETPLLTWTSRSNPLGRGRL